MNPRVRFEEEADTEYRLAGRWYEEHREHLGIEFFDAVDATIERILEMPQMGSLVPGVPSDLLVPNHDLSSFEVDVFHAQLETFL